MPNNFFVLHSIWEKRSSTAHSPNGAKYHRRGCKPPQWYHITTHSPVGATTPLHIGRGKGVGLLVPTPLHIGRGKGVGLSVPTPLHIGFLSPDNGGTEGGAKTIEGKGVGLLDLFHTVLVSK